MRHPFAKQHFGLSIYFFLFKYNLATGNVKREFNFIETIDGDFNYLHYLYILLFIYICLAFISYARTNDAIAGL